MYNILEGLNPSQKEAVEIINGPLLVLAGAGTGKTKVITHRIANLIKNWIAPDSILGLTFTNRAAREMKERIKLILGSDCASKLFLGTFHAFCMKILRAEVEKTPLHRNFTIADDQDQKGILKLAIAELKLKEDDTDINLFLSYIGKAKQELKFPEQCKANQGYMWAIASRIYEKYQEILIAQNMLDFDDILMYTVDLWQKNPEILSKYQEKYKYILIDEFQDTNYAQFKLIELLAEKYKNLCVVGDDDQSIYGWRGAVVENILKFPNRYQNCRVVKLEQNYRSTNNILEAANVFISGNKQRHSKKLWSENGVGAKIKTISLQTDKSEAFYIANQIRKVQYEYPEIRFRDIAILYRSNHQSRLFEEQFRMNKIPYRIVGSNSFYDRKEVRDAVAYLKLLSNPSDDQSLLRILGVPSRNLGLKFLESARTFDKNSALLKTFNNISFLDTLSPKQKTPLSAFTSSINKYTAFFAESGDLPGKTRAYFEEIGYLNCFQKIYKNIDEAEDRRENVIEFINAMGQFEENKVPEEATLTNFLESFSLSDDSDKVEGEEEKNSVTLLTVHSAKGLEFPCVFLVGMEQNLFPHSRALEERDTDEERRLFYVAITRAKKLLYMTNAGSRMKYGSQSYQMPSEFLAELPENVIEDLSANKAPVEESSINDAFKNFYKQFGINNK
ncbi:MAG TPA: ATP-dependent DNA helicase Rep [Lentisphaeria bacterium]|nr:MAG: hypothetical protein A2X47_13890 [Lentisphaerae bacterium GWF2_38_69]HBM16721.1 ATP-dependent DNA helicase Rep [Lentisphaeria bacterium]